MTELAPLAQDVDRLSGVELHSGDFRCDVVRSPQGLRDTLSEWRQLQHAGAMGHQLFQTVQWNQAWMNAFLRGEREHGGQALPCLLLVRDRHGEPVLLWPLMCETLPLRITVISWMSDPFAQYGDVLTVLRGVQLEAALHTAVDALRAMRADLVRLRFVRADAVVAPFLQRHFFKSQEDCAAPWLDLSAYPTEDALEKRFNREQRRRRRRIRRKLEQHLGAELRMRTMSDPAEIKAAIGIILDSKRRWLREKGLVSRALFDGQTEAFLLALTDAMAVPGQGQDDDPQFVITVLESGGQQLSWEVGFRFHGRHYAYITAHLPELTDFSIGRLHMDMAQKLALRDGMRVFDLLVPDAPHKRSWSSHKTPVSSYYLPLSGRGRLLGQTYLNHLRPVIRKVYHRMPSQMRRLLRISEVVEHEIVG